MSRSFLASFRGTDARSIAHALALLLVFNAVFGAFHSGTMAQAATGEVVLCSSEGAVRVSDGLPQAPAGADAISCCVLGFGPSPAAIPAEATAFVVPVLAIGAVALPLFDRALTGPIHPGSASPRGPPILA